MLYVKSVKPIITKVTVDLHGVVWNGREISLTVECDAATGNPLSTYWSDGETPRFTHCKFWDTDFGVDQAEKMTEICRKAVELWRCQL